MTEKLLKINKKSEIIYPQIKSNSNGCEGHPYKCTHTVTVTVTHTHTHTHTGANAIHPTFLYLIMNMVVRFNFDLFLSFLEIISLRKGLFD